MPRFFAFLLFLTLLITTSFGINFAHALDVKNVRFGEHSDKLRTVIELDQKTKFKVFTLPKNETKPYRIVIDLPHFDWQANNIQLPKHKGVTKVRKSNVNNDVMRVVVDMAEPTNVKEAFLLPASGNNPVRLVIDSVTVKKSAFDDSDKRTTGTLKTEIKDLDTLLKSQANTPPEKLAGLNTLKEKAGITPSRKPNNKKPATSSPLHKPLIVIDPGHGGADPGAIGANKLREKDITLSVARVLKKKIEATGRYRVNLTRNSDKYIKLYKRIAIARDQDADLFISLHADSIGRADVRGASVYTLSNTASDKQTAKLAARENQVDLIAGVDLSHEDKEVANILIDLAMRDTMNQSKFFANTFVKNMKPSGVTLLKRPHRFAGFAVLKAPDTPSVLVEMGFMSNKRESNLLATRSYQEKIASALVKSIDAYFSKVRKNAQ